jgi:type II secretory pathway pseudopilin PulG
MKMSELLVSMTCVGILALYTVPTALRIIGGAKVTAALLQLHQTSKQSRYDAIVNYGQVRSVAIFTGDKPGIAECLNGVCGKPVPLPSGIEIRSTFRGIDARVAGRAGADRATLISWASDTNSGIGGSFGQHGTVTFSHPWARKKFCLVRGGSYGNSGEYVVRKDLDCR